MITVLTGGTGGAKFIQGLQQVVSPGELTAIVNTGDDLEWWGLHVSPDLDSVTYALAGMLSRERGWGIDGDTFHCLEAMRRFGAPSWFQLGDRDLATHLFRTQLLTNGMSLTEATAKIARALGVEAFILPMTNDRVETRIVTPGGDLAFQEYFVRERYQVPVQSVRFDGAAEAAPAPGVVEAILGARAVLIAPSNPVTSIGPILAVPGVREALQETRASIVAVTPIIAGAAVSGPAAVLMQALGLPASIEGVAGAYRDFLDVLVVDERDAAAAGEVERLGIRTLCARTLMTTTAEKIAVASAALHAAGQWQAAGAST